MKVWIGIEIRNSRCSYFIKKISSFKLKNLGSGSLIPTNWIEKSYIQFLVCSWTRSNCPDVTKNCIATLQSLRTVCPRPATASLTAIGCKRELKKSIISAAWIGLVVCLQIKSRMRGGLFLMALLLLQRSISINQSFQLSPWRQVWVE